MKHLPSRTALFAAVLAASMQAMALAGDAPKPTPPEPADPKADPKQAAPAQPKPAPTPPADSASAPAAPSPAAATAAATTPAATSPAPTPAPPPPILPDAALTKTIALVRKSPLGTEPNVNNYLDLMTKGKASAAQVNDFSAYVAKRGMPQVALGFQQYALRLEPQNATLWLNLGTIQRTTRAYSDAATSFKKSIAIDPINALAHYNLGAVYDTQGKYDDAIEEYRRALVLDPNLGDPRQNPQVVNNENLLAVKLEIYRSQAGSLGLPLLQVPKSSPAPAPAPAPATKTGGSKP